MFLVLCSVTMLCFALRRANNIQVDRQPDHSRRIVPTYFQILSFCMCECEEDIVVSTDSFLSIIPTYFIFFGGNFCISPSTRKKMK